MKFLRPDVGAISHFERTHKLFAVRGHTKSCIMLALSYHGTTKSKAHYITSLGLALPCLSHNCSEQQGCFLCKAHNHQQSKKC